MISFSFCGSEIWEGLDRLVLGPSGGWSWTIRARAVLDGAGLSLSLCLSVCLSLGSGPLLVVSPHGQSQGDQSAYMVEEVLKSGLFQWTRWKQCYLSQPTLSGHAVSLPTRIEEEGIRLHPLIGSRGRVDIMGHPFWKNTVYHTFLYNYLKTEF